MRLIVLTLFLVGCGTDDQPSAQPVATNGTEAAQDRQQPDPAGESPMEAAAKPEPSKEPIQALTADSADQLPACENSNDRQLVYVIADQAFLTCIKGKWQTIDIKGKDGVNGKDGANGKDGKDGVAGAAGKDGQTVTDGVWYDVVTQHYWTASTVDRSLQQAKEACAAGWRMPNTAELVGAFSRGLSRITLNGKYWTTDGYQNDFFAVDTNGTINGSGASYAVCTKG